MGALGGVAVALVLSTIVVDFVRLAANARRPVPPLVLTADWRIVVPAAVGYVALAALLIAVVTTRSLRAGTGRRTAEVVE